MSRSSPPSPVRSPVFYGWWIVVLGSLINAIGSGIFYHGFTVFFLPLNREFGVSRAAISLLYGATRLEGGVEGPLVGYLIDRFGPRVVIIVGASLAGTGLLLLSQAPSFIAFSLIYIFIAALGYSAGFYFPISAAVNNWFIRRRASGFAIITAAGNIGGMVMAPLLSYIILNYSWRTGVIIAGLIILTIALPAAIPMLRAPEALGLHPDGRRPQRNYVADSSPGSSEAPEVDFTVRQALRTSSYWLLSLGIILRILVTVALAVHLVPILVWKGVDEVSAAYLVSLYAFTAIITTMLMGWLGDRLNRPLLSSIAIVPAIVGMLGLVLGQTMAAVYVFTIALAITMGSTPLNWSLIGDFFGRRSYATLRGIMAVGYGTGTFFSPIYAGWLFDRTGSYTIAFITFSIILAIAAFFFAMLCRPFAKERNNFQLSK